MKVILKIWVLFHQHSLEKADQFCAIRYRGRVYSMVISSMTRSQEQFSEYVKKTCK